MALFEGNRRKPGTVSNTKLIVSGGDSPAEHWKVKQDLPKLFDYPYGGPGQTDVIVSKGMMVAIDESQPLVRNYDNDRYLTQITIANGKNKVIGMAPYNFCREVDDRFTGNQPSIITKEYIELPYFPNKEDAKNCLWGNASGELAPGDLVKVSDEAGLEGRLVKWDESKDKITQVCGQVLAKEPMGSDYDFLEWVMWDERYKKEDDTYINKTGYSAPGLGGYPFDAEMYGKEGFQREEQAYLSEYTTQATGIPGITDGANTRNTQLNRKLGIIAKDTKEHTTFTWLVEKDLVKGEIELTVGDTTIKDSAADKNLVIDYKKGLISYTLETAADKDKAVSVKYKAYHYGTPSHMNFNGVDGVVRILLRF